MAGAFLPRQEFPMEFEQGGHTSLVPPLAHPIFIDDNMFIETGLTQVEGHPFGLYQLNLSLSRPTEPWTGLNLVHDYQPFVDEVIFAPVDTITAPGQLVNGPWEIGFPQEREASNGDPDQHGSSIDDEDVIDEPPFGDPVGPPIRNIIGHSSLPSRPSQAKHQGGRHGRLDEETAERVRGVRGIGACWNCRLQRYGVCLCRQFLGYELS